MQGAGKATVDFREDRDARDALILNGRMWGDVQLEVTKTTGSGNLSWSILVGSDPTFFH